MASAADTALDRVRALARACAELTEAFAGRSASIPAVLGRWRAAHAAFAAIEHSDGGEAVDRASSTAELKRIRRLVPTLARAHARWLEDGAGTHTVETIAARLVPFSWNGARDLLVLVGPIPEGLGAALAEQGVVRVAQLASPEARAELERRVTAERPLPRRLLCRRVTAVAGEDPELTHLSEWLAARLDAAHTSTITLANLGAVWARNLVANLPTLCRAPTIAGLRDRFPGRPALVVSPGPSLEASLDALESVGGRALILAGTRSATALVDRGIVPDLIVVFDPADFSAQLADSRLAKAVLVLEIGVDPSSFVAGRSWRTFVGNGAYGRTFLDLLGTDAGLDGAGSIATSATSLARGLGCDPVILVGQDLALGPAGPYAASADQSRIPDRLWDLEVPGQDGRPRRSSRDLVQFMRWFEDRARGPGRWINATADGARIAGWEHLSLGQAIDRFMTATAPIDRSPLLAVPTTPPAALAALRGRVAAELKRFAYDPTAAIGEPASTIVELLRASYRGEAGPDDLAAAVARELVPLSRAE